MNQTSWWSGMSPPAASPQTRSGASSRSSPTRIVGRRDRALLLLFVLTGRRVDGETAFYAYRGKDGKRGRRELPRPAYEALEATPSDAGLDLASMGTHPPRSGRQAATRGA
jgi:hypothetical protein